MSQAATEAQPVICQTRGKVCLTEAQAIANSYRAGIQGTKPGKLLPFACVFCHCWHTGHLQKPRRRGKGHA